MIFQVFFWSWLLFAGTGSLAYSEKGDEKTVEESNELKQLFWDFSDATEKWNSLYERFEKIQTTECSSSVNDALCKSIQEQVRSVAAKRDGEELNEDMKFVNGILSSIQEKVDRLDRKMESGVGGSSITTRDYINAMKVLERRLQNFQMAIMNLGRDVRLPMKYVEASEDDSLIEIDRPERSSGRNYDYDDISSIKHLGKTCKLLIGPYKKLLASVDRLEEIVKDINAKDNTACALRVQKNALYKNSAFKDIKDMLEDISDDIKSLRKMSSREMNENEKILKKINKKLEKELKDDDKDDEKLKKSLKSFMVEQRKHIEKLMKKELSKWKGIKDTDDDDDDDDDDKDTTDDSRERGRRKTKDDTDDDSDDDDDTDDDDDDDDEDDSCGDPAGCSRRKKGKDTDDSDDDDDDDDDDDYKKKGKKDYDDDEETDSDDDDDNSDDKKGKGKKKKNRENMTKKYLAVEDKSHKDVEVLKNSAATAAAGSYETQKFIKSLLGIPPHH